MKTEKIVALGTLAVLGGFLAFRFHMPLSEEKKAEVLRQRRSF